MTAAMSITVYSIHGSQFTAKVLSALQHRKIPHFVKSVPLDKTKRTKVIPSGGYLVPEIKVDREGEDESIIVSDSEKILHWIDDHYQAGLYPNGLAGELSQRASDGKLAGFVWYYNWVDPDGHARSILQALRGALPWWISPLIPNFVLKMPLQAERTKFRGQACRAIGVEDAALDDESKMRRILMEELEYFQSHLKDPNQPYLVPGTTQPTAADFSVYPQIERLVGGMGAYDVNLPAALPALREAPSLERLWTWHHRMQKECPVQFKGKRPPTASSRL